jgi:hypothetical protein
LLDWVFEKYITNVDSVYEFGCGTGHNLLRVRDLFPKVTPFPPPEKETIPQNLTVGFEQSLNRNDPSEFNRRF